MLRNSLYFRFIMNHAKREDEIRAEIAEHGYAAVILRALTDDSWIEPANGRHQLDVETAKSMGHKLTGSLSDLPVLAVSADVRTNFEQIAKNGFVAVLQQEMEKELANAVRRHPFYAQITDNANYVVREAVKRAMQESRVNKVNGRGEISTVINYLEAGLDIGAKVDVYVGNVKYTPKPMPMPAGMDTAKRVATAMQSVREIPVYGNFVLKRVERPEITPVLTPIDLGEKELIRPSHKVSMSYTGKLTYADMMGLYELGRTMLRNPDKN